MLFLRILDRYYYTKDGRVAGQGIKYQPDFDNTYRYPEKGELLVHDAMRYSTGIAIWSLYHENNSEVTSKCNIEPHRINTVDKAHAYIIHDDHIVDASILSSAIDKDREKLKQYQTITCSVRFIMSDLVVLTEEEDMDNYLSAILDHLVTFFDLRNKTRTEEEIITISNKIVEMMIGFYNERNNYRINRLFGIPRWMLFSPPEEYLPTEIKGSNLEGSWSYESIKEEYILSKVVIPEKKSKSKKPKTDKNK